MLNKMTTNLTGRDWLIKTTSIGIAAMMAAIHSTILIPLTSSARAEDKAARGYVKNRAGETPQPVVAVDSVCAWPNLTMLPDGTIIATIFNQPCHGLWEGDVECWGSDDGGGSWTLRGTPAPHEPGTNRMNVAAGLAAGGDLLVIASGWSHRPPKGQPAGHGPPAHPLAPWVCRSADGGRTWSVDREHFPKMSTGQDGVPFGDILQGEDGALRVGLYLGGTGEAVVFRSADDGKTWSEASIIDEEAVIHEPALLHSGGGKWLLAARRDGLKLYFSEDDARSWKYRRKLTDAQGHPGHFARLKDGRVLLSYGNRIDPKGVDVRLSEDEGKTWSEPLRVTDFQGDGGYPSSVQLPDGRVLTAYYAQRTANHTRYHMGVVVWNTPPRKP